MLKNIGSLIKWLMVLLLIVGAAFSIYAAVKLGRPATTISRAQDFEVKKGEHAGEIVNRLEDQGLISGQLLMEIYLRLRGGESALQAGIYSLDSNMTIPEIVQILSQGKVKASGIRLTVIEGWTVKDIDKALHDWKIISDKETIVVSPEGYYNDFPLLEQPRNWSSLEGFLFPDTYLVAQSSAPEQIVRKMLENFSRKITPAMLAEIQKQNRKFYDVLIMASIVEKEVGRNLKKGTKLSAADVERISEERRIVAGIFYNRLALRMGLESDATLAYVTGSKSPRSTLEELKIDSPYNTYKYRGLPPTPVSNPSLDAIMAVVYPADTENLFFLSDERGTAHFAKTLQEHIKNRALYLE